MQGKENYKKVPTKRLMTLKGDIEMPQLGFGTWLFPNEKVTDVLITAIMDFGYR